MNSRFAILNTEYPIYAQKLIELGYDVIPSEYIDKLISYERRHADMQCLVIHNTAFVLRGCKTIQERLKPYMNVISCGESISGKYPANVCLNAMVTGNSLIGKLDSLDRRVISYAEDNGMRMYDIRQGYAKCSCAYVAENAFITADNGIYNSLYDKGFDILKIGERGVSLDGAGQGFIGGASGLDGDKLYITGNIELHPDYAEIKSFCDKYSVEVISLDDAEIRDIGGIIFC